VATMEAAATEVAGAGTTGSSVTKLIVGSYKVCNFWCVSFVESIDNLLEHTIGLSGPFVLPEVLKPRFQAKRLHDVPFFCDVLEYAPRVSAVAPALITKLFKRGEKRLAIMWIDTILDRD
jgi:hypothetical protein